MSANSRYTWILYIPVLLSVCLITVAWIHSLHLDESIKYKNSILIPIEFGLLLSAIVGFFILFLTALIFLLKKRWRILTNCIISGLSTCILIFVEVVIDSPTLVYIT